MGLIDPLFSGDASSSSSWCLMVRIRCCSCRDPLVRIIMNHDDHKKHVVVLVYGHHRVFAEGGKNRRVRKVDGEENVRILYLCRSLIQGRSCNMHITFVSILCLNHGQLQLRGGASVDPRDSVVEV